MKNIWTILLFLSLFNNAFSQEKSFCPTYVFEGFIETDKGQKLDINLNITILLDSTLVGSYYYNPQHGSLKLAGKLKKDNTINLVERDLRDSITGFFEGKITPNKSTLTGKWTTPNKDKTHTFVLNKIKGNSYWYFIQKNRGLHEYKDLKIAIRDHDKVLSIDVENQNLSNLPDSLILLKNIVSINLLGNNFTEFPQVLFKLKTLDEISLSSNQLKKISSEISDLKNLRILIINNNQLKSLPVEICYLTNLLYLEIGNNQLTSLPDEIKYLKNLQELHIERNKLSEAEKKRIKKRLPNCVIYF